MFVRPRDPERETWDGPRAGVDGVKEHFGADEAFTIDKLADELPEALPEQEAPLLPPRPRTARSTTRSSRRSTRARARAKLGFSWPIEIVDPGDRSSTRCASSRRRTSSPRCARRRTSPPRRTSRAMKATKPGMHEFQVEAMLLETFRTHGSRAPRLRQHRRLGRQRDDPPLPPEQPEDGGRRAPPHRCRLRVRLLRERRHAHVPGRRQVHEGAAGDLRARARRAGGRHRQDAPGRHPRADPRDVRRRDRRRPRDARPPSGRRRAAHRRTRPTSRSSCTRRVTGSAWTCTTSATTTSAARRARSSPGMVLTVEPGHLHRRRTTTRSLPSGAASASASRTTSSSRGRTPEPHGRHPEDGERARASLRVTGAGERAKTEAVGARSAARRLVHAEPARPAVAQDERPVRHLALRGDAPADPREDGARLLSAISSSVSDGREARARGSRRRARRLERARVLPARARAPRRRARSRREVRRQASRAAPPSSARSPGSGLTPRAPSPASRSASTRRWSTATWRGSSRGSSG